MNIRLVARLLGNVLKYEAVFMAVSLLVALYYKEESWFVFAVSMALMLAVGLPLSLIKSDETKFQSRTGFVAVALAWIVLAAFGALPFFFSGFFNNYLDCFFEAASGFTTTGATILTDVEILPKGILFWRSFTHWIGGMGVLVFMMAVMPGQASLFNLMKAEAPGPTPGKIVPKLRETAKILYLVYFAMTVLQTTLLKLAGLSLFDSVIHAFGSAGTGGFSNMNLSVGAYNNVAVEIIVTVFMFLFGINFSLYFLLLKKDFKNIFKNEELRIYFFIVIAAILMITLNVRHLYGSFFESLRYSSFQVSTIITTTGYATTDFNLWPSFSKIILLILMITGCSAGSTGGGMKIVRILVVFKAIRLELSKLIHPRVVKTVKLNGKNLDHQIQSEITVFICCYFVIALVSTALVSLDGKDVISSLSSVIATMSNIGPGFEIVGPMGNYSSFGSLSKVVLSFCMIAGRLEFFPVLLLLVPKAWKKN